MPLEIDADRIAGEAGFGSRQQPVLTENPVEERRLAGIGTANDRDPQRLRDIEFGAVLILRQRHARGVFLRFIR